MTSLVTLDQAEGIALVTLNRPEAMNALSRALRSDLCAVMTKVDADDDVAVVILTGAGPRAFSAGLDLKELGAGAATPSAGGGANENLVRAVEGCRKPVIGAINGVAVAGGFELALACDILIASATARFADTHARVGLLPGWGLSQKLSRTIGIYRARELSFSGNFLDARTAEAWGLVNRVVEPEDLLTVARSLAADIATADRKLVPAYKQLINEGYERSFGEALVWERDVARARNSGRDPAEIALRRNDVQERGRAQQGDDAVRQG